METIYNEKDLLELVLGKIQGKDIQEKCDVAIEFLENDIYIYIRQLTIRIIKLLWAKGVLNLGKYLSEHKQIIIHQLYQMYEQPLKSAILLKKLSEINRYGIIIRMFYSHEAKIQECIYDFFDLLINETKVKEIINKYFYRRIDRRISLKLTIDELIDFINKSSCFINNKFDLYKLYVYINGIEEKNLSQKENIKISQKPKKAKKKHIKKKKETIKIAESSDSINSKKEVENDSKIMPQKEKLVLGNGNKKKENKNTISSEYNKNEINNNKESSDESNIEDNSNINNDKVKNFINEENLLINYLKERQNYYSSKKYDTPILDKIIKGEIKITLNLFLKEIPDNYKFEPYYPNLKEIINVINSNEKFQKEILNEKTIGYICYKNKNNKCVEGIYSNLDNSILYKEITDKSKFKNKDDIYDNDSNKADNYFKARGLSLEYYINCLLMIKFKQKELVESFITF